MWKDVIYFEGFYQVSDTGMVKNTKTGRILKPYAGDYYTVTLSKPGVKSTCRLVHRLVAEAFLPNPNNLPQVNHKDENKHNNSVSNLEWCDAKYNINYGNGKYKKTIRERKPVLQFTITGDFVKQWDSATEVERTLGWGHSNIRKCCNGMLSQAYGFIWKNAS